AGRGVAERAGRGGADRRGERPRRRPRRTSQTVGPARAPRRRPPLAPRGSPRARAPPSRRALLPPERDVLVGRRIRVARDQAEPRLANPRAHAVQERELPDRREHHLLLEELLDLLEQCLALLPVGVGRLLLEETVDVRIAPVDIEAARHRKGLEPRGGIAEGAAAALHQVLELLLRVALEEGRALQRAERAPDARDLQVVDDALGDAAVRGVREVLARIEAI